MISQRILFILLLSATAYESSFSLLTPSPTVHHAERLTPLQATMGRSTSRFSKGERSKRQERVGHLVRTELGSILHRGVIKGGAKYLDDDLRQRISVVNADVSPDLRHARISVSIRAAPKDADNNNPTVDKRRAYSWLVRNTKPIRHSLAQRMKHMKSCPDLTFVQVDVAAAVDVMYLIDKVSQGYKRDGVDLSDEFPKGVVGGIDFDEEFDAEEWEEEDEDFF